MSVSTAGESAIRAMVSIEFKPGVLDPEAAAINKSLHAIGFEEVASVRRIKQIELALDVGSTEQAEESAKRMCETLLANPVIEAYKIEIVDPRVP